MEAAILPRIQEAARWIRQARHFVVLTGAGFSTPSGIPDFRSDRGLWARYDPMEVASLQAFRHHPERFYRWMRPLARDILAAEPNAAHRALARLEQAPMEVTIITQNIDQLHQRAGSRRVIEVHGSLRTMTCTACYRQVEAAPYLPSYLEDGTIPHCEVCGAILKPDVILFGEQLPLVAYEQAREAVLVCDVMLVAGSSLEVMPVAGLPMEAVSRGGRLIIVNQSPTYLDPRATVVLHADVESAIPAIVHEVLHG